MCSAASGSRIVVNIVRNGIRNAVFAPTLLLTCYTSFAAEGPPPPVSPPPVSSPTQLVPTYIYPTASASYPVTAYGVAPAVSEVPAPKPFDGLDFGAGVALTFGQHE